MLVNQLGMPGDLLNQIGLFAEDDGTTITVSFADKKLYSLTRASGDLNVAGALNEGQTL